MVLGYLIILWYFPGVTSYWFVFVTQIVMQSTVLSSSCVPIFAYWLPLGYPRRFKNTLQLNWNWKLLNYVSWSSTSFVYPVWRHHLQNVNKSLIAHFKAFFFNKFIIFVIFLNTQMDLFILKTDVEKFTSTNKRTLHLIFNKTLYDMPPFHPKYVLALPWEIWKWQSHESSTYVYILMNHWIASNTISSYSLKNCQTCSKSHNLYILCWNVCLQHECKCFQMLVPRHHQHVP